MSYFYLYVGLGMLMLTLLSVLVFGFLITRGLFTVGFLNRKFKLRQITAGLTYLLQLTGCGLILFHV